MRFCLLVIYGFGGLRYYFDLYRLPAAVFGVVVSVSFDFGVMVFLDLLVSSVGLIPVYALWF